MINYLREFCHQPYFSHFAPHLTQQEVRERKQKFYDSDLMVYGPTIVIHMYVILFKLALTMILPWLNPSGSNTTEPASDACSIGFILNIDRDKKRKNKNCGCEKLVGLYPLPGLLLYYRNWLINIKTFLL